MSTYSVDGIALDDPAGRWYLLGEGTGRKPVPGVRSVTVMVTGQAGEYPINNEDHETTTLSLTMLIKGYSESNLEDNVDAITALFSTRYRMLTLQQHVGNRVRETSAKLVATSEPELLKGALAVKMTLVLRIPGVYWRDTVTKTWSNSIPFVGKVVTPFVGSTAPITDALIRITGPASGVVITDVASGGVVSLPTVLVSRRLLIDAGRMRAASLTTDTWDLAAGTNVTGNISATGPGSAYRWIHLTPSIYGFDPNSRAITVTVAASGTTSASLIEIQAKGAFL